MADRAAYPTETRIVRHSGGTQSWTLDADICVAGAGITGVSAAIEAAKLGRRVLLIDGLPSLGGQMVNSIIGTFCGVFANGDDRYQFTHGVIDGILDDLGKTGDVFYRVGPGWTTVFYDEIALSRWVERNMQDAGVEVLLGAVIRGVEFENRRIRKLHLATRYGDVEVTAKGFVDASGDAVLTWLSGLDCREPAAPIYGTQMVVVEGVSEDDIPSREEIVEKIRAKAGDYGVVREDGLAFFFEGRGIVGLNMTHIETPLEPLATSAMSIEGKRQADNAVNLLRHEFPKTFGDCRIRVYGLPGIRQTRWIVGKHHLTVDEVIAGTEFDDAVARTAWGIEIHNKPEEIIWDSFGTGHVHYVPLASLTPPEADNIVAAGRCIDADVAALSSVRVMAPCAAMGAAAANALDLAGDGSVHQIDLGELRKRLHDNVERTDHYRADANPKAAA